MSSRGSVILLCSYPVRAEFDRELMKRTYTKFSFFFFFYIRRATRYGSMTIRADKVDNIAISREKKLIRPTRGTRW
jgi:hypothetical protein